MCVRMYVMQKSHAYEAHRHWNHAFIHQQTTDIAQISREPWGIVGFGAQLLGLRVALSLGLQTKRLVVGNA
jgi:hypothetical protein